MLLSLLVIALMALYVSLSISILQKDLFMPFFMHLQNRPDNDFISPITTAWTANPCDMAFLVEEQKIVKKVLKILKAKEKKASRS
ncbi:hypothetical protein Pint_28220 [Pistacia integerrima]|uniref:Uncharacterized protein n=1 Tax=Pistacia integerrima TaxID=434235 RepID=A0ACC0YSQ7_9ROSI|nr:hypothetical protein Pint_28220 [Pistacia integerrima]